MGLVDAVLSLVDANLNEAREKGLNECVPIVKSDMKTKVADKAVLEYYMEYTPKRYDRTGSLFDIFEGFSKKSGITIKGWVEDFPDRMPQHYSHSKLHQSGSEWISRYDSSFNFDGGNGIPESSWILENFWQGIHPIFYVNKQMDTIVVDASIHGEDIESRLNRHATAYMNDLQGLIIEHINANL